MVLKTFKIKVSTSLLVKRDQQLFACLFIKLILLTIYRDTVFQEHGDRIHIQEKTIL